MLSNAQRNFRASVFAIQMGRGGLIILGNTGINYILFRCVPVFFSFFPAFGGPPKRHVSWQLEYLLVRKPRCASLYRKCVEGLPATPEFKKSSAGFWLEVAGEHRKANSDKSTRNDVCLFYEIPFFVEDYKYLCVNITSCFFQESTLNMRK